ncbi:hypothetical protein OUZ56_014558 [Daphnia magna]|uniref:Uncharacterized protein n=1 Tax=Daphnia magna TaxID=35525 RepID=A0ABR0AKA6_9CRUS|nr:hypothetical protein OUZ56_014558 [Daphnia magna]
MDQPPLNQKPEFLHLGCPRTACSHLTLLQERDSPGRRLFRFSRIVNSMSIFGVVIIWLV